MTEAYATIERWAMHFNAGESEAVTRLYTPYAALWGTLSQNITASAGDMQAYFIAAARLKLTVRLGTYVALSPAEDIAAITGHYDLSRTRDGCVTLFPARYSFVLVKQNGTWLIAQHHSSLKPDASARFRPPAPRQ